MPKIKLTDTAVTRLALEPGQGDLTVWDSEVPGFGIRLRPSGRTWVVGYRPAGTGRTGQFKRHKIGSADLMKAAEARAHARVVLGRIATGADPLAERRRARENVKLTMAEMLDRYEAALERRGYVRRKEVLTSLRSKLKPLLTRDIRAVTGADLATEMAKLEDAGKPGAAAGLRAHARAFLTWCVTSQHVLASNPLLGHRRERATRQDKVARDEHGRALSDAELCAVWRAADPTTAVGRLTRFYILSGCRRNEGSGLTRAMVDYSVDLIRLPAIYTKQGRGHIVPLVPALASLLAVCPIDARSDLFFASSRTGGVMSGWSKFIDKLQRDSGVLFTLHDLRRTLRTGMSRLGVDTDTAELAIGHAREDLEKIYNRDEALDALRAAFSKWSAHVETVVQ